MFIAFDGIVFDLVFLDGWQIESDMSNDGCDFLRWHHIIDVAVVLNKDATAAWKFPVQNFFADNINRRRANEVASRLLSKSPNSKLVSNQLIGEDAKKYKSGSSSLKLTVEQAQAVIQTLPALGILAGSAAVGVVTTTLPSGQRITPPVPAPPSTGLPSSYPKWDRPLTDVPYNPTIASQQGSTYTPPLGGNASTAPPAVSPTNSPASSNPKADKPHRTSEKIDQTTILDDAASFIKRQVDLAKKVILGAAGAFIPSVPSAASLVGAALSGAAGLIDPVAAAQAFQKEFQAQLEEIGKLLGITRDDIFGAGRQPIKNLKFPVPPVKNKLNPEPPRAQNAGVRGSSVPITYRELENRLNKPRRPLAIWLNSGPNGEPEYMLFSPYPGFTVDALSGPTCKMMHLPAIHGNVTGIMKLRFETWVAPPPQILTGYQLVKPGTSILRTPAAKAAVNSNLKSNTKSGLQTVTDPRALVAGGALTAIPTLNASIGQSLLIGGVGAIPGLGITNAGKGNQVNPGAVGGNKAGFLVNPQINPDAKIFLGTPPLLSNRWTMREVPDPSTCLNCTIIEGTAHFRMDVLQALQLTPDQLRPFFMHPIPFGYVRMPPEVTVLSDGASVQYTIKDVQQMLNNPGGQRWGVHSVSVKQEMQYHSPIDYVRTPFAQPWGMNIPGMGPNAAVAALQMSGKIF